MVIFDNLPSHFLETLIGLILTFIINNQFLDILMRFELLNASSRESCFRIAEPFLSFQNHVRQHLQYTSEYGNLITDLIEPFLTIFVYSAINRYSPMLRWIVVDISRPRLIFTISHQHRGE